jgi:hypothetical protein
VLAQGAGRDCRVGVHAQARQARQLRAGGESIADIMATLGVARSTLYRALSEPEIDA